GPHVFRKARTRASLPASRRAGGSGTHVLIWSGPLPVAARNSPVHSRMADGVYISAPRAPMLPAPATAADRLTGHAPAMGASMIGIFNRYFSQKVFQLTSSPVDEIPASR